jgi:RHS repeat-associated protein
LALIIILSLCAQAPDQASSGPSATTKTKNRITSISPDCAGPGDPVKLTGHGFGARSIIVTVGGIRAQVVRATGRELTFLVPASVPEGPTTVEIRHKKGCQYGSIDFRVGCAGTNRPPLARAGQDQDVTVGDLVLLDGRESSDPDGDLITYLWTIVRTPAGSSAELNNPFSVTPAFVPDLPGEYLISLTVNDGESDSPSSEVLVIAFLPNVPPRASAGPDQSVVTGSLVSLDGTGSFDPDGDPLTYDWQILSRPEASGAVLDDSQSPTPSFLADRDGRYTIQLVVYDGNMGSFPDDVLVISATPNAQPVAFAGDDQVVSRNTMIHLDGTGSTDPENDALTYAWSIVSMPAGSAAALDDPGSPTPQVLADAEGEYVFRLVVNDGELESGPDAVVVRVVNDPPVAHAGPDQEGTVGALVTLDGSGSSDVNGDALTYSWAVVSLPGGSASALNNPTSVDPTFLPDLPGPYTIQLIVNDGQTDSGTDTVDIHVTAPVLLVDVPDVVGMAQAGAEAAISAAGLAVGGITTAHSETVPAGNVISQSPAAGTSVLQGSAVSLVISLGPLEPGLPPDPATVAPPVDPAVATAIGESTEFLYTGSNPIQTGVAAGTIEPRRAAVIRGRVLDRNNAPLPGVTLSILDHPEFGQTLSRADGMFDMAVNGGGILTVRYQKEGFLTAQRQVDIPWQDYAIAPDVVLIVLDSQSSTVVANAGFVQVHEAAPVTDADGTRQAVLLFPAGLTAQMVMPDGRTQPIESLTVRATEYTVGPNGPKAMPAPLPPTTAYTYAVELSVDEAAAAGAAKVTFDRPVLNYVENFLDFPIGMAVPTGYYDREKGAWIPSENGRVIRIAGVTDGLADVDSVGSRPLPPLVMDEAERRQLASLYSVGQSLWRVPIPHFSPWDHNWPYVPPPDAVPPPPQPPEEEDIEKCLETAGGSIIECQNQILGESVAVAGTPFELNYRSDRAAGRTAANTVSIVLSRKSVPASLRRIDLKLEVAGRTFTQSLDAGPNQTLRFTWDGLDAYGRRLQGRQTVTGWIDYAYRAEYAEPAAFESAFGSFGTAAISGNPTRGEITISQPFTRGVGAMDARPLDLGGWTLSSHHAYDPASRKLYLGDGSRRGGVDAVLEGIFTVAGGGANSDWEPGSPATEASLTRLHGIAVSPNGSVFLVEEFLNRVHRVDPDGSIWMVAGGGSETRDGIPAVNARLAYPQDVALHPDGSLYILVGGEYAGQGLVRRVDSDGIITTVAGSYSSPPDYRDGIPAIQASLGWPTGLAVGPDGSLYISDLATNRVRRVDPAGIITTVAGTGDAGFGGDGGPAIQAELSSPRGIAVADDGSLYIADSHNLRIRRVSTAGIITTIAGTGASFPFDDFNGDGIPATLANLAWVIDVAIDRDGNIYISDGEHDRIRRIDSKGIITTVAGTGDWVFNGDGIPPTRANLNQPMSIAMGPDGSLFISDQGHSRVRVVRPVFPGLSIADFVLASEDGRLLYHFNGAGRHERTLHALTGAPLKEFTYDSAGRLASVVEKTGGTDNVTTIVRNGDGNPLRIVGPFGQETTLTVNADGYLETITNPAAEQVRIEYTAEGLLTRFTDPRGNASLYTYDDLGRLIQAADRAGGTQTYARTELENGYEVTRTTALGRTTTYRVERLPSGSRRMTRIAPSGEAVQATLGADGTQTEQYPDGTVVTTVLGSDPRFGMQTPFAQLLAVEFPSGLRLDGTATEAATLWNATDPLSLQSLVSTAAIDGQTTSTAYTQATKTIVTTSPGGRTFSMAIDAQGRFVSGEAPGLGSLATTFDSRGRLAALVRGSGADARTTTFAYDAEGYLSSITDPMGRVAQLGRDGSGRITSKIFADGRTVTLAYDSAGNVVEVTPPGRPPWQLAYSSRNELVQVTPPAVPGTGPTTFSYDLDRQAVAASRPDGREVALTYDAWGRRAARSLSTNGIVTATDVYSYDAAGRLSGILPASGVDLAYTYDGSLLTEVAWAGAVTGDVGFAYDAALRLIRESLNGGNAVGFAYDADDLLTAAGEAAITRDAQSGFPTAVTLANATTTFAYNSLGEVVSTSTSVGADQLFAATYTRDKLGRITRKIETVQGVTSTYDYSYSTAGQLLEVRQGSSVVESYAYDDNGNRVSATVHGTTSAAAFDLQDRILSFGSTTFAHNGAGDLVARTTGGQTTAYEYDALGNLLSVKPPSGRVVSYLVDGRGRRVGKRVGGVFVKQFLYADALSPAAELDGEGNVVSRFVYGENRVPIYMTRAGTTHLLVKDSVGSVRLVVDASTGAIAQRLDYDAFGNLIFDTNPGFQPFGFAGGLYDPETGLVRMGARDYDATIGRWTTRDPRGFGGFDTNLYRYAGNDPINLVDPTGASAWDTAMGFLQQAQVEAYTLVNPAVGLWLLADSLNRMIQEGMGHGSTGPSLEDMMAGRGFPSPLYDKDSEDYAKGSFAASCAGLVAGLGTGNPGILGRGRDLLRQLASKIDDLLTRLFSEPETLTKAAKPDVLGEALKRAIADIGQDPNKGVTLEKGVPGGVSTAIDKSHRPH